MAALGQPLEGSVLHSDLDSVYTSYDWLRRVLLDDGLCVNYSERRQRTIHGLNPSGVE
jgi:hypothetical protein